ncbi:MAG: N-acetylmuramoyl-L-alanine amidase [Flavobacteriales bacterium]
MSQIGAKAMQERKINLTIKMNDKSGKRLAVAFLALAFIFIAAIIPPNPADEFVVVLDAGHGGTDPGNLGTGRFKTTEKNVALDVTLKVGQYINENFPEVKVVYTRKGDTFPTLARRVEIANTSNADLFISIHCNAAENKTAQGVETFVMGLHKSEESLANAMKENASIFLEEDHEKNYDGFDPKNPDTYIIMSMRENLFLDHSIRLAKGVQDQFRTRVGRKDRGVKQAGFYVISYTNMPSVLVELGFLSHSDEEDFLNSDDGKTYLASAIYRAFKDFKDKADGGLKADANEDKPEVKAEPVAEVKPEPRTETVSPSSPKTETLNGLTWKEVNEGIKYQVQIVTSPKKLAPKSPEFKGLDRVDEYKQNGVFKYLAGASPGYKEAKQNLEKLKELGFKDAFIVAFQNGERIDLSKAIALTSN